MSEQEQPKRRQSDAERKAGLRNLAAGKASSGDRGATKHGVYAVIHSQGSQIPAVTGAQAIAADVDGVLDQISRDLGGDLTGAQREILRSCRVPMLVLRLAESYMIASNIVDKKGRPHGLLRILCVYSNTLRLNLTALGLERRARDAGTLEAYIAEKFSGRTEGKTDEPVKQTE
jgi:hypothetical protein